MQMSDAGEVVQVAGYGHANDKLNEGWVLLAVVPNANNQGQVHVAYVLGKPRAEVKPTGNFFDGDWVSAPPEA